MGTTEKKTFDKNVTEKMPTITSKFTKLDERITEASGEEEISTAELLTGLGSDDVSFSTKSITELNKTAVFSTKESILPALTTELKRAVKNITEISIEDKIPKYSAKEKIEIDYITTISAVPTELKTLDEKVIEASVEDKMSTKIIFNDLRSDDIPLSTESIMGVDKLFTTESIELDKTTEKIITKFPSSGVYFSTDSIAEIPSISTDLKA